MVRYNYFLVEYGNIDKFLSENYNYVNDREETVILLQNDENGNLLIIEEISEEQSKFVFLQKIKNYHFIINPKTFHYKQVTSGGSLILKTDAANIYYKETNEDIPKQEINEDIHEKLFIRMFRIMKAKESIK